MVSQRAHGKYEQEALSRTTLESRLLTGNFVNSATSFLDVASASGAASWRLPALLLIVIESVITTVDPTAALDRVVDIFVTRYLGVGSAWNANVAFASTIESDISVFDFAGIRDSRNSSNRGIMQQRRG